MSLEVELNRKAGRVCPQAMTGDIRCPLIVRESSEDVLTGEVLGHLRHIRPHLWLGPLLNLGLGVNDHRQVWFKNLSIRFWERQSKFPPELLSFKEGRTEVDVVIEWENPATTLWIEAKLWSGLSERTTHSENNDQALRGIRTLLAATGNLQSNRLFLAAPRRPFWLALLPRKPEPMVERYRSTENLRQVMPGNDGHITIPSHPFVGTITWEDVREILAGTRGRMNSAEASIASRLKDYLDRKLSDIRGGIPPKDYISRRPRLTLPVIP